MSRRTVSLVTLEDLRRLTGRTWRTIRDRLVLLEPAKADSMGTYYDSRKALALIYDDGKDPDGIDLSTERAELARMQRRRVALEVAKLEYRLVEPGDLERFVKSFLITVRSRLLALPRSSAAFVSPENPKNAERILDAACRELLEELASDAVRGEILDGVRPSSDERVAGSTTAAKAHGQSVG